MALWRFFDYITESGDNVIMDWYGVQDPEVQVQFDVTLLILGATENWESDRVEEFKPLERQHIGLGEIIFHINALAPGARRPHRRRFRPVGIWPTAVYREFILLLGCEKRGRQFIPHDAFGVALRYKTAFEQGIGTTHEHV
jgi:hypothetical protein